MLIPSSNQNGLECIEEVSSTSSCSSSHDGADWLQQKDLGRLSRELNLSTTNTECVNLQNSSINIDNSSDVVIGSIAHFHGPVTIVQNPNETAAAITAADGEKKVGKLVKSESVSSEKSCSGDEYTTCVSKQRILLLGFAFLTIATTVSLAVYFTTTTPPNESPDKNLGDHKLIYRAEWGGQPPQYTVPVTPPVDYVIISHSATPFLTSSPDCAARLRNIQDYHVAEIKSPDIGYNFVICGDGNIYVARGWDVKNFHMVDSSIGICFIGNFIYDSLTNTMIEAVQILLELGLEKGRISEEYKLVAHNQTTLYENFSPGPNVYKVIKEWPHFYPGQVG